MFSGAGVLIFQDDNILLFRERKSKRYTEPGGKFDKKHDNIEDTAIDELYEETCCLFDIRNIEKRNNYVDIEYIKGYLYRLYIINIHDKIEDIEDTYKQNLKRLVQINAEKYYLETDDVVFVKVDDILKNNKNIIGDNGKKIKLRHRVKMGVSALFDEIENIKPLNVTIKKIIKSHGLKTYLLK